LIENKCPPDTDLVLHIAQGGNLEMLIWALKEYDFGSKKDLLIRAAQSGNIKMLGWLLENNYWDIHSNCSCLIKGAWVGGHLETFKWLLENKRFKGVLFGVTMKIL
jgi:hypothetical protein